MKRVTEDQALRHSLTYGTSGHPINRFQLLQTERRSTVSSLMEGLIVSCEVKALKRSFKGLNAYFMMNQSDAICGILITVIFDLKEIS